ncbi:exonuclease domain-containing protein [Streptomonospora litoralis]|uniref:DNA polymerase III subunit epsilon n=1 Tax=Streptomonospora litoralis TaxID=2498135 RepID=A0A4P6Q804_9ACTN|nr:exonuclease domain-containing protein [Streptomonospora litoralis]QBI56873.1 DNA polymerase III subunit epsilon [Streptomonospora litoralis]
MTETRWFEQRMLGFDLETTSKLPEQARIVQYALPSVGGGLATDPVEVLVDPGVEVPQEAAGLHGITTELVRAQGTPAAQAVADIVATIGRTLAAGTPVVGHNAPYDYTMLDRECRRHLGAGLAESLGRPLRPLVDTLVLSRHLEPKRRRPGPDQGPHALKTCVQALVPRKWGIGWDDDAAHGALYDALMSLRVAAAVGQSHPRIGSMTAEQLHDAQATWYPAQVADLEAFMRRMGNDVSFDRDWPLLPPAAQEAIA